MKQVLLIALLCALPATAQQSLRLFEWERGIGFEVPGQKEMRVYLWFYEWNMFEAREPGQHTGGRRDWPRQVTEGGLSASVGADDLRLRAKAVPDGVDLVGTPAVVEPNEP